MVTVLNEKYCWDGGRNRKSSKVLAMLEGFMKQGRWPEKLGGNLGHN